MWGKNSTTEPHPQSFLNFTGGISFRDTDHWCSVPKDPAIRDFTTMTFVFDNFIRWNVSTKRNSSCLLGAYWTIFFLHFYSFARYSIWLQWLQIFKEQNSSYPCMILVYLKAGWLPCKGYHYNSTYLTDLIDSLHHRTGILRNRRSLKPKHLHQVVTGQMCAGKQSMKEVGGLGKLLSS